MSALTFAAPALLAAFLLLPAIWLLLRASPPAPKRAVFPPFSILRKIKIDAETPRRMPLPLLLLRLAIAALAIVGLAGPAFDAATRAAPASASIIVIDDSWAAAPGWKKRLEAARAIAAGADGGASIFLLPTSTPAQTAPSPMTPAMARAAIDRLQPKPWLPDYRALTSAVAGLATSARGGEAHWLSDGLLHPGADDFHRRLKTIGPVRIYRDDAAPVLYLKPDRNAGVVVARVGARAGKAVVVAEARDGREIARAEVDFGARAAVAFRPKLPLSLFNDIERYRLVGVASAGAVKLVDSSARRSVVGLPSSQSGQAGALLSDEHYLRQALAPHAEFTSGEIADLVASEASVIILTDVGRLRDDEQAALENWILSGGVLVRFAGPVLAEAAQDDEAPLLPTRLRGGGRAFGGALTWESPQALGPFSPDGPFARLAAPADVFVRRQVLAEPGGETSARTWASLSDGTPIVTGERRGDGALALFHITATPDWSDLPLSSVFVDMLRSLAQLSVYGPSTPVAETATRLAPLRVLDGFGAFRAPPRDAPGVVPSELVGAAGPTRPPGLYGSPDAAVAVNAVDAQTPVKAFSLPASDFRSFDIAPPRRFGPFLIALALALLIVDALVSLRFAGRLRLRAAMLAGAALFATAPPSPATAAPAERPLDRPIPAVTADGALRLRLAYVATGRPEIDRIAALGLSGLSRELWRRTSVEPADPAAVNPETDDLSIYPFLYWPVTAEAAPSNAALANLDNFMRLGGLVVFDTRDADRAGLGAETPEGAALRAILRKLNVPPLAPPAQDHVLNRSFYLLDDLSGRSAGGEIWVDAGSETNDAVTPLIIGGRDWAGAWARDGAGDPLLPMANGDERRREFAFRAGINMVMVALTGNYKSDQVHAPILIERLGK